MTTEKFIEIMNSGELIKAGSLIHETMHHLSQEAIRITMSLNSAILMMK